MAESVDDPPLEGRAADLVTLGSAVSEVAAGAREQPSERGTWGLALAAAVAGHVLVLLLALPTQLDRLGDGGTHLEAVTVSIVMEAPASLGLPDAAKSEAAEQPADASPAAAPAPEPVEERKPDPKSTELRPREPEPVAPVEPDPAPSKPPEPQPPPPPAPAPAPAAAPPPRPAIAPRASAGDMRAYARKVALALARSKPKGSGRRGTATIRFVVGSDGKAGNVAILKRSGSPRLDRITLTAIGRIVFPSPPPQATVDQRTFVVPYEFR